MKRAIILVLDSFGIGATADAADFGDVGANTLGSIARHREDTGVQSLQLPNLTKLGLMHAAKESCGAYPAGCEEWQTQLKWWAPTDMLPS